MRYLSFRAAGKDRFGILLDNGVVDLSARTSHANLRGLIAQGGSAEAKAIAEMGNIDFAPSEIEYLIPVPDTDKIVCVGVNYPDRNAEYRDGSDLPKYPSLFLRTRGSFVGHGQALQLPPESVQFDYEGEIVLVIGKAGRRIGEADALDHVFGLSLCNEGSVRDWMRHGKFNVTQGKNFNASGAIGPWIVPVEDSGQFANLQLTTRVNGELRQHDNADRLMFPFARLISYISTFMHLLPGDLIVTGTPTGSGARFDPPKYLVEGDVVSVAVPGIGTLENRVEKEAA